MFTQNYFVIFSLHGLTYGVNAMAVKEIFSLPELVIAIDAPEDIVGLLNLREKLIPVMDLNRRFGYPFQEYRVEDSVITLERDGEMLGIVVNQVREVVAIATESIENTIYSRHPSKLISGVAKLGSETIALLRDEALFDCGAISSQAMTNHRELRGEKIEHYGEAFNEKHWVERQGNFFDTFCSHMTDRDRRIFHTRAERLMQTSQKNDLMGLRPLAVVGLGDEYFGLDLEVVREFTEFHKVTPIPCCPDHVIGNINLRGEIITLIDIRRALHMQIDGQALTSKAIVVHIDDLVMGIPVEKVFDVLYLQKSDIKPNPMVTSDGDRDYLQGTVPYQEKMMGILNLAKIFAEGNLSVNEEV
ncbi:MAG: chemotaxis protein CheW [Pseudanabaenaceae cyanobacterium bins.39]|nr:chemotaxis protein CheW [Pseudanabaenaceae cyanobacterium bins.39]